MKALRLAALLLTLSGVAGLLASCGGGSASASTAAAERLQREDLVAVARGLRQAEPSARREIAAASIAWPLVASGLPAKIPPATLTALAATSRAARAIVVPPLMSKPQARSLTGPASGIAGLFQSFSGLTGRGWTLTHASSQEIASGSPAASRFARENVALYIDSVYDGHFDGGLIGKSLLKAYTSLAGSGTTSAFGGTLTQAEVSALAGAYSPASERLHPHPGVKLGS
ncbi:MAG TPA: hypothetical protein VGL54_06650 [Solirubrobacteraceae bacterium]